MKSAIVVMRFSFAILMTLRMTSHQSDIMSVGPRYMARNESPELAARPTLP